MEKRETIELMILNLGILMMPINLDHRKAWIHQTLTLSHLNTLHWFIKEIFQKEEAMFGGIKLMP